jgi:hypothetical protein
MKLRIKIILAFISSVILFIYLSIYFQEGIMLENHFFRLSKANNISTFSGQWNGSEVTFLRNESMIVSPTLIEYRDSHGNRLFGIDYDEICTNRYEVKLTENNELLFEGQYDTSIGDQLKLFDTNGEPYFSRSQVILQDNGSRIYSSEVVLYEAIAKLALRDYTIHFRGKFVSMMIAGA